MYTTYSAGHAESRFPYPVGTGKGGHKPGHQTVRTQKAPARRKPYGFLNRTLQPIAPDLYTETYRGRVNLTTEESFDYLYRSALNYVQLLEMELPYTPPSKASPREKICRLYQVLDASLATMSIWRCGRAAPILHLPVPFLAGLYLVLAAGGLYGKAARDIEKDCAGIHQTVHPSPPDAGHYGYTLF